MKPQTDKEIKESKAAKGYEEGEVTVEFLAVAVFLLIPLVYLVLTLAALQQAAFAAESAVAAGSRMLSLRPQDTHLAQANAMIAFQDQGISPADVDYRLDCLVGTCPGQGSQAQLQVLTQVRLPLLPDFLTSAVPLHIPITAQRQISWGEHGG